jgi:hypothetical protein
MNNSKTEEKLKRAITLIYNNYGLGKEFLYQDVSQKLENADIHKVNISILEMSGVLSRVRRGVYILTEYKENSHKKANRFVQKHAKERKLIREAKSQQSQQKLPLVAPKVRTRAITDKYIVEQYEKRGLGKKGFWQKLVDKILFFNNF